MKKDYYQEKIGEIKKLIQEKKYNDAYDLLNEEFSVPYIPKIYESQMIDLLQVVKPQIINKNINTSIPKDIAIDYLISNNEQKELMALEFLKEHNLRSDIEIIKNRIETWPFSKNLVKAYLFELLVEQEIDVEIEYNGILINPKNGSILEKKEVKQTMQEISELSFKNPSIKVVAEEEFQKFLLLTYPSVPESPKESAIDFVSIAKSMIEEEVLSPRQEKIKKILELA